MANNKILGMKPGTAAAVGAAAVGAVVLATTVANASESIDLGATASASAGLPEGVAISNTGHAVWQHNGRRLPTFNRGGSLGGKQLIAQRDLPGGMIDYLAYDPSTGQIEAVQKVSSAKAGELRRARLAAEKAEREAQAAAQGEAEEGGQGMRRVGQVLGGLGRGLANFITGGGYDLVASVVERKESRDGGAVDDIDAGQEAIEAEDDAIAAAQGQGDQANA